ncbi:MAG: T9SS type A sorting domain-containing protein [bacterium]
MRKLIFILVALVLIFQNSFADNKYYASYFPLQVGNEWTYLYRFGGTPVEFHSVTTKDSTFNNNKYYFITFLPKVQGGWIRYDSLTGNLLKYDGSSSCNNYINEIIIDSLSAHNGAIGTCPYMRNCYNDSSHSVLFNLQVTEKSFVYNFNEFEYMNYAKDFGISTYQKQTFTGSLESYSLIRCIINGNVFTGIRNLEVSVLPKTFYLEQNFPNPFNPTTIIRFHQPDYSETKLFIVNSSGQKVKTILNDYLMPGSYEYEFTNIDLSSGVYFYVLESKNVMDSKKMIILK